MNENVYLHSTYQPDEAKTERTVNWILDNEFGTIQTGENNTEDRIKECGKPDELRLPSPVNLLTSELDSNEEVLKDDTFSTDGSSSGPSINTHRKTITVMRDYIDSEDHGNKLQH